MRFLISLVILYIIAVAVIVSIAVLGVALSWLWVDEMESCGDATMDTTVALLVLLI